MTVPFIGPAFWLRRKKGSDRWEKKRARGLPAPRTKKTRGGVPSICSQRHGSREKEAEGPRNRSGSSLDAADDNTKRQGVQERDGRELQVVGVGYG